MNSSSEGNDIAENLEVAGSSSTCENRKRSAPPSDNSSSDFQFKHPDMKKIKEEKASTSTDETLTSKQQKKIADAEKRLKMQRLVQSFSEDQLSRYEMYRRSSFPKAAFKRLMQNISGSGITQNVVIAMSGISKIFVGEVMEEALDVMEQLGDTTPVKPKHIREAVRRLKSRNTFPFNKKTTLE